MTHTAKHTPGPWHVGLRPGPMVYGPQGEQIVGLNVMLESDEVLANAKFIAAAPAMYEALRQFRAACANRKTSEVLHTLEGKTLFAAYEAAGIALAQAEGSAE